jgi:glucose/arabinose dehydrogenase
MTLKSDRRAMRCGGTRAGTTLILAALVVGVSASVVCGQTLKARDAFGDWKQDKPGVRRLLTVKDLPQPSAGKSANNFPQKVQMPAGAKPVVPPGFSVDLVTSGLAEPRVIRAAPNGDLFITESKANAVRVLRIPDGTATPSHSEVFVSGLNRPYGIAFYPPDDEPEWLYVANCNGVIRFRYKNGDLKAEGTSETVVGPVLWTHHWTRDIVFSPDGKRLYLSVGSGSNVAQDMFPHPLTTETPEEWIKAHALGAAWDTEENRAQVLAYAPDGKNQKTYATGLRNASGIAIQSVTGQLWGVVNERDELGEDTPFEYATHIKEGAFYGWPWYYLGPNEDPRHRGKRPDLKDHVTLPDVYIQAHSAPLQIAFYNGDQFPADYKGDAFVTLHGSWNRGQRTGYKVIRLLFDDAGKPTGEYEDFMTGFVVSDQQVWGRPVGVTVTKDGSLFVTEDGRSGTVWRVSSKK